MRNPHQLQLPLRSRGGARPGAGRKPGLHPSEVPHRRREKLSPHTPVHLTVKLARAGLPSLRQQLAFSRVRRLLTRCNSPSFRVVHWSVQEDHVHLIAEANDRSALSRAMARFNGMLARMVNRLANRRGSALRERYHERQLKSPRQVFNAIRYVLNNAAKHGARATGIDTMSSGPMFDGWAHARHSHCALDGTVLEPRTWLLRIGWRRHGAILLAAPSL